MRKLSLIGYRIEDGVRDVLEKSIADRINDAHLDPDANTAILAGIGAHALRQHLPGELLGALSVFPHTGHHALLIDNLPQQEFPATPVDGFADEPGLALVNAVHLGVLHLLGLMPYAVEYENDGLLMRNVAPNPAAAGTTSSWGADTEFFWHTDNPHLRFGEPGRDPRVSVPRYLTFYAVRNEEQVATELMAVEDALDALSEADLELLTQPIFEVGAPASTDPSKPLVLSGVPVLERRNPGYWVRFDLGTTRGVTPEAVAALDNWREALGAAQMWQPVLDPGQVLVFDNYRSLHRRTAFTPADPDRSRWLRRCYASA
ncbi:TauD/TfdA family dioxygenase [Longispora albida]|uniref:TauD/TfdA family dioxygenase n=1 Tax=Longispora albida TaxID=203523 RepID=UPI0003713EA4|nr:TauD/TfdA family dioxygenase [Longispora albida]